MLASWKESYHKPRQHIKEQRHHFANRGPYNQCYVFSFFPLVMYECESWIPKESWVLKNWCFQIMVLEKTLEIPLDSMESKPVNRKGNQSWIFGGRMDAEAETPVLWPPDVTNWLIGKNPDAGKDWRQKEKGMTEDEMVGWHHWFNGHEFEQTLGDREGQESLACCCPWGHKESDMTEQRNWTVDYSFII